MVKVEVCVKRVVNGLEELEILAGTDLGTSDWLTVTQDMVDTFSEVTGDHQWIHLDVERARRELPFGGPIVQGLLTLSLIVRFRYEILELRGVTRFINYGYDRVRFTAPIPVGSRLRATQSLLVAERITPDALRTKSKFIMEAEGIEKPVCIAEAITLVYA
jgi:acyl dehydratase